MSSEITAKEQQAWDKAVSKHDIRSYEKYLGAYPMGHYSSEAKTTARHLKEAYDWSQIQKKTQYTNLIRFVRRYPRSQHLEQARELISEMEEEEIWKHAKHKNQLTAFRIYAHKFPDGEHYEEACEKITVLEERLAAKRHQHVSHSAKKDHTKKAPKRNKPTIAPESPSFEDEDLIIDTDSAIDNGTERQVKQPDEANTTSTENEFTDALAFDDIAEAEEDAKIEELKRQQKNEQQDRSTNKTLPQQDATEEADNDNDLIMEDGEQEIWDEAVSTDLLSVYKMYIEWYPNGFYTHYARQIIYELEQ